LCYLNLTSTIGDIETNYFDARAEKKIEENDRAKNSVP
jgi:hypothetical protein